jgi:hypothetical protein
MIIMFDSCNTRGVFIVTSVPHQTLTNNYGLFQVQYQFLILIYYFATVFVSNPHYYKLTHI